MECLNTTKNLKINQNKTIGEVVVVVEGESEEFKLLKHIFVNVFDYNYIPVKRNRGITDILKSKTNKKSTVIIVNTSSSSMKSIFTDVNFEDELYDIIMKDFKKSLKNIPIYILWDRDKENNTKKKEKKGIETFRNSMDNDYGMNGLFLISYPCVESYEMSNFNKQTYLMNFVSSDEAKSEKKAHSKKYSLTNISEDSLLNAAGNMHRSFINYGINNYDPSKFYEKNKRIFKNEEAIYKTDGYYNALSLITVMLVDLGIIYEEEKADE